MTTKRHPSWHPHNHLIEYSTYAENLYRLLENTPGSEPLMPAPASEIPHDLPPPSSQERNPPPQEEPVKEEPKEKSLEDEFHSQFPKILGKIHNPADMQKLKTLFEKAIKKHPTYKLMSF